MESFTFSRSRSPDKKNEIEKEFRSYVDVFRLSNDEIAGSILDVGSGDTSFVRYLRDSLNNKNAFAVEKYEINAGSMEDGVIIGDGFLLPFNDGTFETVTSKHYLSQFANSEKDLAQALAEILRVAKVGGKIAMDIPTPEDEASKLGGIRSIFLNKKNKKEVQKRYRGASSLKNILEDVKKQVQAVSVEKVDRHTVLFIKK